MKFLSTILISIIAHSALSNKEPHKVFEDCADIISKANTIRVFEIEKYPVVSADQAQDAMYVFDYEINKVFEYERKNVDTLSTHLLDTTQFVYGDSRSCPFVGKMAIEFTRGKKKLTLLFSEQPCYKLIIFCPGSPIDKKHIDLSDSNEIYSALLALTKR